METQPSSLTLTQGGNIRLEWQERTAGGLGSSQITPEPQHTLVRLPEIVTAHLIFFFYLKRYLPLDLKEVKALFLVDIQIIMLYFIGFSLITGIQTVVIVILVVFILFIFLACICYYKRCKNKPSSLTVHTNETTPSVNTNNEANVLFAPRGQTAEEKSITIHENLA